MKRYWWHSIVCFLSLSLGYGNNLLHSKELSASRTRQTQEDQMVPRWLNKPFYYPNFTNNPAITPHMQRVMKPYVIPLAHPMKPILDDIFSQGRVTRHEWTLRRAGFKILFLQKRSHIRVVTHPRLKGYLIKLYPDCERAVREGCSGWKRFTTRCMVAQKIKKIIAQKKIKNFVVADKWLYPLPIPKKRKAHQQPVVLLVQHPLNPLNICLVFFRILNFVYHAYIPM